MREMKDSGVAWIGAMPNHWKVSKIKQVIRWKSVKGQPDLPVLSLYRDYGVIPKDSRDDNHNVTSLDTSAYKVVERGDLVINKMKAWQGSLAVSEYNGIVSPAYHICQITSKNICKKYLHYLLRDASYLPEYMRLSTGLRVGQWDLSFDDFKNIPFLLPPLAEQERIAAFLDAECAEIDAVLEKTRASIGEYKKLKQAVITQAVTKGIRGDRPMKNSGIEWIGDIPAEWKVASIGRFCFVTKLAGFEFTNDMMSNIQDSGDIPIVRAQNIKMGKFINNISEFIPYRISQKLERCALNRKCLIITFIGAGIGEVAIFNEPKRYHLAPNVAKIVINVGMEHFVTEEYLLYFLMSSAGQEEINKIKKATAQPSLSMGTIRSIKMVLPDSIEEQSEIVSYLDIRCAGIDALIAKKQQYLTEIENYKKSLIYEYVTGKKEVI